MKGEKYKQTKNEENTTKKQTETYPGMNAQVCKSKAYNETINVINFLSFFFHFLMCFTV